MHTLPRSLPLAALLAPILAGSASAQFADDLETYAVGSAIEGQGSWSNWDGGSYSYNTVTGGLSSSGSQSLRIVGSNDPNCGFCSDTVSDLGGPYTSGQWTFSCKQYIPNEFGGTTYWIMLNQYAAAGPYSWSVQVPFNASTAVVTPDTNAAAVMQGPNTIPIVFDQWVELRAEIDLDNDVASLYYDGQLLVESVWSIGVSTTGTATLQALDLFPADQNVGAVFYDDFKVEPGLGSPLDLFCDPANANSTGNPVTLAASSLSGPGVVHLEANGGPLDQFGIFVVSATSVDPGIPVSDGRLCVGAPIGRYTSTAGPGLNSIGRFDASGTLVNLFGTSSTGTGFDVPAVLPSPPGGIINAGQTWHFQLWYRDGVASNFSDGLSVTF